MAPLFGTLSPSFLVMPSHLSHLAAVHSRPFDPAAVRIGCLFVYPRGSLCCFGCSQVKGRTEGASEAVAGVISR